MSTNDDLGKLIVRLTSSLLLFVHGYSFLMGDRALLARVQSYDLPEAVGWAGALLGEVLAPILVALGVYSRIGALFMMAFMITAIGMSHMDHIFAFAPRGGGLFIELQLFFLLTALAVFVQGAGRIGLNIGGRWN